jgi:hypothetical protein
MLPQKLLISIILAKNIYKFSIKNTTTKGVPICQVISIDFE